MQPGVYFDLPADEYHAAPGLSCSGMDDLEISPLRYWYRHINPDRPTEEDTPALAFGTALHMRVLEPARFEREYACELDTAGIDGLIVTIEDCRAFLRDRGLTPKGTKKADLVAQVHAVDPSAPIYDLMAEAHAKANYGKTLLTVTDWDRLHNAAGHILAEPEVRRILDGCKREVSVFAEDPKTGVLLKCRADVWHPKLTADLKSFSQRRGKSINRTISEAIVYEGYWKRAYTYSRVRRLAEGQLVPFVLAFVESDLPHETRIVSLQPMNGGEANVYWETARLKVNRLIETYAECSRRFGKEPWREPQQVAEIGDEDIPQIIWSN